MVSILKDWISIAVKYLFSVGLIYYSSTEFFAEYSTVNAVTSFFSSIICVGFGRALADTKTTEEFNDIIYLAKNVSFYLFPILVLYLTANYNKFIFYGIAIYISNVTLDLNRYKNYATNNPAFFEDYRFYAGISSAILLGLLLYEVSVEIVINLIPYIIGFMSIICAEKNYRNIIHINLKEKILHSFHSILVSRVLLQKVKNVVTNVGMFYFMYTITHSAMYTLPVAFLYNTGNLYNATSYSYGVLISGAVSQFTSAIFAHRLFNKRSYEFRNNIKFRIRRNIQFMLIPILLSLLSVAILMYTDQFIKSRFFPSLNQELINKIVIAKYYLNFLIVSLGFGAIQGISYYTKRTYLLILTILESGCLFLMFVDSYFNEGKDLAVIILLTTIISSALIIKGQK